MRLLSAMALLLLAAAPAAAGEHGCACIYAGGDVELGQTACIKTPKGRSLARCDMVLNNTSWTILDQPCEVDESAVPSSPPPPQRKSSKT